MDFVLQSFCLWLKLGSLQGTESFNMEGNVNDIDWQNFFYPHIPVTLRNRVGENKCSLNAVFQALKACPAFRNFVHNNLRNRSWKCELPVVPIFQNQLFYAFWESFLSNDLRDGPQSRHGPETRKKQPKSVFGFDGEKNFNNTRFSMLDVPWEEPIFGFADKFQIGRYNEMLDIHDIVGCLDQNMLLTESQLFVTVHHDLQNAMPSCFGQEIGPFIRVNPLFPTTTVVLI